MVPAVALRHPDDLAAVGEVGAVLLAAVEEEGLGLLLDDGPGGAGRPVDLDHPVDLVAALVVFEGESPSVFPPGEVGELVGIGEEGVVDLGPRLRVDRKEHGPLDVQGVARLGVLHRVVLRLELVGRRGLDVLDDAMIAPAQAHRDELFRIRGPGDGFEGVIVTLGSVAAEDELGLGALVAQDQVVVPDEGLPLAVGRGSCPLRRGLGGRAPLPHGHVAAAAHSPRSGPFELLAGIMWRGRT